MLFKRLIIFLLVFITFPGYGQQYEAYKINYGVNDGLPSSECYEIIQDSKGYIWFGTDRGVVKYNGYEFTTYTTKEGLNNNVVFYLKEGPDGKIWFYDVENQLSYFYKDKIYPFKHNTLLNKFLPKNSKPIGINIDSNNNIYFNFIGNVKQIIRSINLNGEVTFHDSNTHDIYFSHINDDFVSAHFSNNGSNGEPIVDFNVGYLKKNRKISNSISSNLNLYNSIFRFKKHGENIYFSYMNELYNIKSSGEISKMHTFENSVIELEVSLDGDLYVGLYDQGLMILPNGSPTKMYKMISECSVSGVCFDDAQGLWITTQDKGIYYVSKSKFSQHIESKDQLINHISGDDNGIIYTNYAGELFNLNTTFIKNEKTLTHVSNEVLSSLFKITLGTFRKHKTKATDILNDDMISQLNNIVDKINDVVFLEKADENSIYNYKNFMMHNNIKSEVTLNEALTVKHAEQGKELVNMFVGRFQPFTLGHAKVLEAIHKQNGYPVIVFLIKAKSKKKGDEFRKPYSEDLQIKMFKQVQKQYKFLKEIIVLDRGAIDYMFNELRPKYEPVLWGTGSDRMTSYGYQVNNDSYRDQLNVRSDFGLFEIPRTDNNISATQVRNAMLDGDESLFKKTTPKAIHKMYDVLKSELEKSMEMVAASKVVSESVMTFQEYMNKLKS